MAGHSLAISWSAARGDDAVPVEVRAVLQRSLQLQCKDTPEGSLVSF